MAVQEALHDPDIIQDSKQGTEANDGHHWPMQDQPGFLSLFAVYDNLQYIGAEYVTPTI
jgi:hypothetical protein